MKNYLYKYGIVKSNDTKSARIFEEIFPDIFEINYQTPSGYIDYCWNKYDGHEEQSNNINGLVFEYILATLLIREDLLPFYLQAEVVFVPNVRYDLLLYTKKSGPIAISAKTSLRERYKQADLESIALKYVHRRAKCYLVTLNANEGRSVQKKIENGDVIGLDNVAIATTGDIDDLIATLKGNEFIEAPKVDVVQSDLIVTRSKVVGE
ncbi:MAG: hypothetical protein U9Q82_02620 [Chloroflexota bacterium]|nr:hypothetical protein [Chloroflexota bacterium]